MLLLGILLFSPFALAQEQVQTYSGFNRFIDDVKLTFSGGDNKVRLALNIREKEINSAVENGQNGNDEAMSDNLENAWKKLQIVQEKVSINTAEQVKENSNELRENVMNQVNLSKDFDVYVLEEEKTGLTAEWVVENSIDGEGKEGQTLGREVAYEIDGEIVIKIENRIDEIDNEIAKWVVENSVGKDGEGDNGLMWEVKNEIAKGDDGLKPEVKTQVAGDGTLKNDPLPTPNLNEKNYDPSKDQVVTNIIEEKEGNEGGGNYAEGTTAEGNCGDGVDCGSGNPGTEGVNEEPSPAVDSNEGDEESLGSITGEVISNFESNNLINKIFNWLF